MTFYCVLFLFVYWRIKQKNMTTYTINQFAVFVFITTIIKMGYLFIAFNCDPYSNVSQNKNMLRYPLIEIKNQKTFVEEARESIMFYEYNRKEEKLL